MYEGLDFPIELGIPDKIESFNGWDARKYFNWLINCIPDRVEYLKNYITSTYHINTINEHKTAGFVKMHKRDYKNIFMRADLSPPETA